jgi:hypothetical protein
MSSHRPHNFLLLRKFDRDATTLELVSIQSVDRSLGRASIIEDSERMIFPLSFMLTALVVGEFGFDVTVVSRRNTEKGLEGVFIY